MGFRFYKRVNLGGGVHLNLSKTGVGISAGVPGARYSVHSSGRSVKTVGVPGTGMYYRKDTYAKGGTARGRAPRTRAPIPPVIVYPKAGLFAPKQDKAFTKGVAAYMRGAYQEALGWLGKVEELDQRQAHVSEELFAAMCMVGLKRFDEAIPLLEIVVGSHQAIPDGLMMMYGVAGSLKIQVTPMIEATVPLSSLAAALVLAELYQHTGHADHAIELLESLGSLSGYPSLALSLAELYEAAGRPDDVLRVSEGYTSNTDDLQANLLAFRASALSSKGLDDAALQTLKEALRFPSRDPQILRFSRYVRAHVYEQMGRNAPARKDLERIYAEDPHFLDVSERLGMPAAPEAPLRPEA